MEGGRWVVKFLKAILESREIEDIKRRIQMRGINSVLPVDVGVFELPRVIRDSGHADG